MLDMLIPACVLLSFLHGCLCADLTYYVEEEKGPGTYLGDIAADTGLKDSISRQNHEQITFSLLKNGEKHGTQMFHVSQKTGKLYTAQTLDAETLCTHNVECFQMLDVAVRHAESFMQILEVKVVIEDINDYKPEFPVKQVSIKFSEADGRGIKKSIPSAIDKDIGPVNSKITYFLKKNRDEPFTLSESKRFDGKSNLAIRLEERLNRELKERYLVQIIAKDGASPPQECMLDVHILVTDENDNAPTFRQNIFNISVKNEVNLTVPILVLTATDSDTGKNGKVSYRFSPDTSNTAKSHFKINEKTGGIFLSKKLNSYEKQVYNLYIEASDEGNPPLSSVAMVVINVINQQNYPPTIDINFVSASIGNTITISEDINVGSFIAYVKVTDHNAGRNGEVACDLHHDKFQLQSLGVKKYKISVKNPLDRETDDHYDIIINCQDKGNPPLHTISRFSVSVMDVNDVQPHFSKEVFKFWVSENRESNFPVGWINVTDPDMGTGGQLVFSLIANSNSFLPFQISDHGMITTVMSLDHEFQDTYHFQVLVKDSGVHSLNNTVNVIVEVKDENDNVPYFTFPSVNPYTMEVRYHPQHPQNITTLKASDRDSRENAFLKYTIIGGNDKQLFAVNHYTGLLSFTRAVIQQDAMSYDLQFVVKDSGTPVLSATTTIFLILTVSNETIEGTNAVHLKSRSKIHLHLLIVIVLVAVTVSIPVTAAISISFIHCKSCRSTTYRETAKPSRASVSEQKELMRPSCEEAFWLNAHTDRAAESEIVCNPRLAKSRRRPFQGDKLSKIQKRSTLGVKLPTKKDIVYQVST